MIDRGDRLVVLVHEHIWLLFLLFSEPILQSGHVLPADHCVRIGGFQMFARRGATPACVRVCAHLGGSSAGVLLDWLHVELAVL